MNTELPNRKKLRLQNYDYSRNGCYFVTVCTHERQILFKETVGATLCGRPNEPGKMIEKWLLELGKKFCGVEIPHYAVMPNHVHFIVTKTGDHAGSPLHEIVSWFKTMTTNDYIANVKFGKFSPFRQKLWQRNYYEHIIRDDRDYYETAKYIENNLLKWELDKYYCKD